MNNLIERFLDELITFDYIEGEAVSFNGLKAPTKDSLQGLYRENHLFPLYLDFQAGLGQFHMGQSIQGQAVTKTVADLQVLEARIQEIIDTLNSREEVSRWKKELALNENNSQRARSLVFLIEIVESKKYFAGEAKDSVAQLTTFLLNPKKPNAVDSVRPVLKFRLTEFFSKPKNKNYITDLRRDLTDMKYLSKGDPNNTLMNFRKLFATINDDIENEEALPIRWCGNLTELKYFIYCITDKLIQQDYTRHSNYYVAFQLFRDQHGKEFKPKELRFKGDKPATFAKLDKALHFLQIIPASKK